jgi:hypothetical protein
MQLKGPLLQPTICKKSQDTKTAWLQVPNPILDDANPNTNTMMMFSNSPPAQPKKYLGNVSSKYGISRRCKKTTSFMQTSVEIKY